MAIMPLPLLQDPPRMLSRGRTGTAARRRRRSSRPGAVCGGDPREVTRYPGTCRDGG